MSTRLIDAILSKMPVMNKWRKDFFRHILHLFLSMRGRHNFENMERYGVYNDCTYRQNFEKPFDFALFNRELIRETCGPERIAAFDPSYVAKNGKHTPGVGWHWSGSTGKAKWVLEIGGIAVIRHCQQHSHAPSLIRKIDKVELNRHQVITFTATRRWGSAFNRSQLFWHS